MTWKTNVNMENLPSRTECNNRTIIMSLFGAQDKQTFVNFNAGVQAVLAVNSLKIIAEDSKG